MDKKQHFIWMPLIGFDREQPDRGVGEYLETAGFVPEVMSVFIFHPDIINEHENMDTEFTLHPDLCSYFGSPRNEFRQRQPWTNYELRDLAKNLADRGIEAFVGVDGVYLENTRHYEWESDHPELLSYGVNGRMNLNVLKRFKDGTYYEDFFCEKVVKCVTDYGFAGLHVADFFCPPEHSIVNGDYSSDMLDQFAEQSGVKFSEEISQRLGLDEQDDIEARQKYIWGNLRREWIDFYVWRWQKFWTKISTALHAIGKKVLINNAWCSDPFEALYRYGIDYRVFYRSGVDYFVAEALPTSCELLDKVSYRFQQYMSMAQVMRVFNPDDKLYTLLGVKDCTEEWDAIHHVPMRLEKDMYVQANMFVWHDGGYKRTSDGYMVTLGDGITKSEWKWINERADLAFGVQPQGIDAPTVIWSDNAHYALLDEYIRTRRPSYHKQFFEIQKCNASTGAVARVDELDSVSGAIFVPNLDLCSEDEIAAVLGYTRGTVICTADTKFVADRDIKYEFYREDSLSDNGLCIFASGLTEDVQRVTEVADGFFVSGNRVSRCPYVSLDAIDPSFFLTDMPFAESSEAFCKTLAYLINNACGTRFKSDMQILPLLLEDGTYRIYVINHTNVYQRQEIMSDLPIASVVCGGKYPVMPPKFVVPPKPGELKLDGAKAESMKIGLKSDEIPFGFVAKVPPLGISVFDVTLS